MDPIRIRTTSADVLGKPRGRRSPTRQVFVAYRMQDPTSVAMRKSIGDLLAKQDVLVVDGHQMGGEYWAPTIRKRISDSKLVVADVTGPRREVIFEMGFAGDRVVLPIVERVEHRDDVPGWLSAVHIPTYAGPGLSNIATRIVGLLTSTNSRPKPRPKAVPGRVLWLQPPDAIWCEGARERARLLCAEAGPEMTVVDADDLSSPEEISELLRNWIIIAAIDGGRQDYLAHYLLGDIMGRTKSGSGSGKGQGMDRRGIILTPDPLTLRNAVASSLRSVPRNIVAPATPATVPTILKPHLDSYRRWLMRDV